TSARTSASSKRVDRRWAQADNITRSTTERMKSQSLARLAFGRHSVRKCAAEDPMRRLLPLLLLAGCPNNPPASTGKSLTILHTTDEHSHIVGFGPELDDYPAATAAGTGTIKGGIGRRAALVAQERARAHTAGGDSTLVSAGDNSMGTLAQAGEPTNGTDFAIMKALGYDATTLGNHEFDFGPNQLAKAMMAAGGVVPTIST